MKDFSENSICKLFGIKYPIIQAGMIWVSGGKLAAASANAGILGLIGAGSMSPELLEEHIKKAKSLSKGQIGVNLPLIYGKVEEQIEVALKNEIKIFFTSAGSPKKFTKYLQDHGAKVAHVVSTPELAKKCEDAGVDAVVAEGFEAGGHNGRDEITSMVLIPQVADKISVPFIAAGGIADGRAMAAAFALGAQGVQVGSRFVCTKESSAHQNFQEAIVKANSSSTMLSMKKLVPVRLLKNKFYEDVTQLEDECASKEKLAELLGKGRAKKGMLEGDLEEGELEIGQVSSMINDIPTVNEMVQRFLKEYQGTIQNF